MIYLDNCATTKMRPDVLKSMIKTMEEDFANPSSLHKLGYEVEKKVEKARKEVANYLKVKSSEIYWTSGGTESNNTALKMVAQKLKRSGNHIITTKIEHPSVIETLKYLKDNGFKITYLDVDETGQINLNELKESIIPETILISIMQVNNEIGTLFDIYEIGKIIKEIDNRIIFHVDGVQGFGKISLNLKASNVDLYSFSGHKIYGPKGIGGLFIDEKLQIDPFIHGGNQEDGMRSGTENISSIVGFGKAVEIIKKNAKLEYRHVESLKEYFVKKINDEIKQIKINSAIRDTSPYILHISIIGTRGEVLLHYLEQDNIYISTSSACSSKGTEKSHVLRSIGLTEEEIEGSIRICFSYENTKEEIDKVVDKMKEYVEEIRNIMMR